MNNNVHILPVAKRVRRRAAAGNQPHADVLQIIDYCQKRSPVETPEQKVVRLERLIDSIAYQLLTAARVIAASRSITSTKGD